MNTKAKFAIIGIIILGIGFYGGTLYAKNSTSTQAQSQKGTFTGGNGNGANRALRQGGANGGNMLSGEIVSKDATSISIKLRDGGSKIIFLTSSTPILKTIAGSSTDLTQNEQVTVFGSQNSDGSVNAQSIQLRSASSTPQR